MTAKDILLGVKDLLLKFNTQAPAAPVVEPAEPVKMAADVTLKDGSIVQVDKLEVGGLVTKEGQPVPDAEHVLEDGRTITTVAGAITEIKEAASATPSEPVEEDMKKQVGEIAQKFAAVEQGYKAKFEAQEANVKVLKESVDKLLEAVILMGEQSVVAPKEPAPIAATENFKKVLESRGKL